MNAIDDNEVKVEASRVAEEDRMETLPRHFLFISDRKDDSRSRIRLAVSACCICLRCTR
jgi:hypothetical protein